jgi:ATP-binding cassette, subfamily B, bacterial PglK
MFQTIYKINELLDRRSKIQFGVVFIFLLINSILEGFGLGLIVPYITVITDSSIIFNNSIFQKINVFLNINTRHELVLWMSTVLIVFFILKNMLKILVIYFESRLIFTKRSNISRKLFNSYMNAPYSFHLNHNSAELDRNIRFEIPNVFGLIQNFLLLFSNILLVISIFIVLIWANWQAVITMGLFITCVSFIYLFFTGSYSKKLGSELQNSQLSLGQTLKEGISSFIECKILNIESYFPDLYLKHYLVTAKANWRQATITSTPSLLFEILAVGTIISTIIYLSLQNIDLISIIPIVGLFSFAFIRLIPSVTAILKCIQEIQFRSPALEVVLADLKELATKPIERQNSQLNNQYLKFKNISLQNVSLSYNDDKNVIDGLSMEINKGESIGITGPSGSGKTTLISLILGLHKANSGIININDEEMQNHLTSWQSIIGYVPQSISLVDASIRENIALGVESNIIDNQKVWSVLKDANLIEFVKDLPMQLDTFIGENGMRISGGQRQRLGLARALYRSPEVLIFDEATSSLDVKTEKLIIQEILKLSGKRTLIIVTHRISTIKGCDVIFYLKDGEIVNSGRYNELKELTKDFKEIAALGDF